MPPKIAKIPSQRKKLEEKQTTAYICSKEKSVITDIYVTVIILLKIKININTFCRHPKSIFRKNYQVAED